MSVASDVDLEVPGRRVTAPRRDRTWRSDMAQATRTCALDACDRVVFSREWCQMHYTRWLRHGDPARVMVRRDPVPIIDGRVPLLAGEFALIDPEDAELVGRFKWRRTLNGYVVSHDHGKLISLHRLLLPGFVTVDHRNRNPLDNRRSNLRPASPSQQNANMAKRGNAPYKGVRANHRRWRAVLQADGRNRNLGSFATAEEAARAWDTAAIEAYGEFAATNESLGLLS